MTATMTTKYPITDEGHQALLAKSESWLQSYRTEALERHRALPFPVRTDEQWRRTSPKWVSLEGRQVVRAESGYGLLTEGEIPSGVTFGALEAFLDEKSAKIHAAHRRDADNVFSTLNEAFWNCGTFLHIEADSSTGQQVLQANHHFRGGETALALPRTVITAGRFSKSTVLETFTSDSEELLAAPLVDIELEEGANLKYVLVQQWGDATTSVPTFRATLAKDSQLQILYIGLDGKITKLFGTSELEGANVKSEVLGLVMASERQHFDIDVTQNHRKGENVSDVLVHIALADKARSIFSGNVLCEPGSQKIDGYQQNRNLLLSSTARADSMPKLEIEANDVRCTHGATFTTFDEGQYFYCRSRGLDDSEAKRLLVRGFFQEVVNRIEHEIVVEHLMDLIATKMDEILKV